MKYAGLLKRDSAIILYPEACAASGVLSIIEPMIVLEMSVQPTQLGATIREVLSYSRSGLPHPNPSDSGSRLKPLLRAAKAKSWAEVIRGAKSIEIAADEAMLFFTPTENRGPREGFWHLPELAIKISIDVTAGELATAALQALGLSK